LLLSRCHVNTIAPTAIFTVVLLQVVSLELFTQITVWPPSCVETFPWAVMRGPTRILTGGRVGKASLKKNLEEVQAQRPSQLVLRKFYLCESRFIHKMHQGLLFLFPERFLIQQRTHQKIFFK